MIGSSASSSLRTLFVALADRRLGRYDLVLAAIPLAFLLAGVVALALSVPPRLALTAAAAVGAVAVADSLFLNPPTRKRG